MADKKGKKGKDENAEDETMAMKIALVVTSAAAAWVAQKVLSQVWKAVTGNDAPKDPLNNNSTMPGIIAFGALAGAAAALSRVLASKGANRIANRVDAPRPKL